MQKALAVFDTILFCALGLYSWTANLISHLAESEYPVYKSFVSRLGRKSLASCVNICKNPLLYITQYVCVFIEEGRAMGTLILVSVATEKKCFDTQIALL